MPGPLCGNNVGPTIAFGSAATLDQAKFFTRGRRTDGFDDGQDEGQELFFLSSPPQQHLLYKKTHQEGSDARTSNFVDGV
jgi:hypothetical protein